MKIHMNVYLLRLDQIQYNCRHCVFFFILNTTCAFLQRLYDHGRDCFRDIHIVACMSHVVWDMKPSCTLSSLQLRPLLMIFVALGCLEDSVFSKLICIKRRLIVMWMGTMQVHMFLNLEDFVGWKEEVVQSWYRWQTNQWISLGQVRVEGSEEKLFGRCARQSEIIASLR